MKYFTMESLGITVAVISFIIGSILVGLFYFTEKPEILLIGYIFIVLIMIVNVAVFIASVIEAIKNKPIRKKLLTNSVLMLLNIPVAYIYLWFMMVLLNTIRLTLINPTDSKITDINIIGCESNAISSLEAGESKTVWISISNDCSIYLKYIEENTEKTETVIGYATNMGGQKASHKIGEGNQEL